MMNPYLIEQSGEARRAAMLTAASDEPWPSLSRAIARLRTAGTRALLTLVVRKATPASAG